MSIKKILIIIFISIFLIIYAIFNGDAFLTLVNYKYHRFVTILNYEMNRPLNLDFKTPISYPKTELPRITSTTKKGNISSPNPTSPLTKLAISLPALPKEAQTENILELPKFNIKAPIKEPTIASLKEIYRLLRIGVVLFPGSTQVGGDYAIILGHSSSYPWTPGRYKSVFSLLNQFEIGDQFFVYYNQKPMVYEVMDKKVFLPWPKGSDTTETLFPPESGKKILILQSCWPVGVDYKRVAVKAELVSQ